MKTLFEKSQKGQRAFSLPKEDKAFLNFYPKESLLRKSELSLPEVSEIDLTRHFSRLAQRNMGIDTNFYPLGSCTMKLNPRVNEYCASLAGFVRTHPLAPLEMVQGNRLIMDELVKMLCDICGMSAGSLLPNAGAQGELSGIKMFAAYHRSKGDHARTELLIPDNAHGTNPATATMSGFKTITIKSDAYGDMDVEHLKEMISEKTAGLMLTNPNTLGIFSSKILEISKIVHEAGGLLFYDGANLNPLLNVARPGEMGFDVMHINLHKTFSTPHGGGGPGSGPILCNERLKPFLPCCLMEKSGKKQSIGSIATFHGNFAIYLRAYVYIKLHGHFGLRRVAENAVLNANYLKKRLGGLFKIPFEQFCMHEFVVQADRFLDKGIKAMDIAKRLLDYGIHAPTVYFPLIVKECMLIEPTECESKATLDHFIEVMQSIVKEIEADPAFVKAAPHSLPVKRLDEVLAARHPRLHSTHNR